MTTVASRITLPLHIAIDTAIEQALLGTKTPDINIPYLVGPPGGGKTKLLNYKVKTYKKKKEGTNRNIRIGYLACAPGLERVEKFGGIPDLQWVNDENLGDEPVLYTKWSIPQLICEMNDMARETIEGEDGPELKYDNIIVLFDDWHLCAANIQQIGFELFTHRSLNGHKIPDNVGIILAGNEKSSAGAKVQLSAIRNRCTMMYCISDVEYWLENYALPNNLHPAAASYFNMKDKAPLFHEEEKTNDQYASPRSWTSAFKKLKILEDSNMSEMYTKAIIMGDVGPVAASDFWTYYKLYRKVDGKKIYDTGKYVIPTDGVELFAFGAVISDEFYNQTAIILEKTKRKPKERAAELKRIGTTFTSIMNDLTKTNVEIATMAIIQVMCKPGDKNLGLPTGMDILTEAAITYNSLDTDVISRVKKATSRVKQISEAYRQKQVEV